jgi:hypothetical protein
MLQYGGYNKLHVNKGTDSKRPAASLRRLMLASQWDAGDETEVSLKPFNSQWYLYVPFALYSEHRVHLCVSNGSHNKQRLFP